MQQTPSINTEKTHSDGSHHNYCCASKKYYSHNENLSKTLEILPRTVIFKKSLKLSGLYEQMIRIKNNGLYPRRLLYHTDSSEDTNVRFCKGDEGHYLEPSDTVTIHIRIHPVEKRRINRRRSVFIVSEHPNIIFEVPIIIILGNPEVSIPRFFNFSHSVPGTLTYYEFIIYNPLRKCCPITIKSLTCLMQVQLSANAIPIKDYIKVLLTLTVRTLKPLTDIIKVKLENAYMDLSWAHYPVPRTLYLSASQLNFDELTFGRQAHKEFTLCNESQTPLNYRSQFYSYIDPADRPVLEDAMWVPFNLLIQQSIDTLQSADDLDATPKAGNMVTTFKHFALDKPDGVIEPNASCSISLIFNPIESECHFPDGMNPPFKMQAEVHFSVADEQCTATMRPSVLVVTCYVNAPKVQFKSKLVELRPFIGEEHCEPMHVKNLDDLTTAVVAFKGYDGGIVAHVDVLPIQTFVLKPNEQHPFMLHIYTFVVGKFSVKLRFKVKNGHNHFVVMTGISRAIRMRVFPDILELGSIPFAVPQKKSILVMNPLSVPIVIRCKPADDGNEKPLVLNPYNVNELMPVNVRDEFDYLTQKIENFCPCEISTADDESDFSQGSSYMGTSRSFHSVEDGQSMVSSDFEDAILQHITEFSKEVVANIKVNRLIEKTAVEERTVREAMQVLMQSPYFARITEHQNFAYMDWNAVPSDPQELYCGNEMIYLSPNTGKHITVLVIPNKVGYYNRSLDVRCCPYMAVHGALGACGPAIDEEKVCFVATENLASKIFIEYHCRLPDIDWNRKIWLDEEVIYAGQDYGFDMCFENLSTVGGFVHYTVVPDCADGVMTFSEKNWKFFIGPENVYYVNCVVFFRREGAIKLSGLLKFVGQTLAEPYHILADVLPPAVRIAPKAITCRQKVLVKSRHYIYVDNATPTKTRLTFELKCDHYQSIDPKGFLLGPANHGMYLMLESKFFDPDTYRNTLQIRVLYGKTWEIPVTFHIGDMPIFFNPPIRNSYDLGRILVSTEEDYQANISNFTRLIRVSNKGKRSYRLITSKLRNKPNQDADQSSKAHLLVSPKVIHIRPGQEELIHITASGCEACNLYNEFRIQIMDTTNVQRFKNLRLVITGELVRPDVQWTRKEIVMNFDSTHKHQPVQFELAHLYNPSDVYIDRLRLSVTGPFYIKELYEDQSSKEVAFLLPGLTHKEITVVLHKAALDNRSCSDVAGRVHCTANDLIQKPLMLRVNILRAKLKISNCDLVLFLKHREGEYELGVTNIGCMDAHFRWKKQHRELTYVATFDDSQDFAQELLSDVVRHLDLGDDFSEVDSLYERNMTLRYQHYRCQMRHVEDTAGAVELLDDIIDHLDFEHKRYKLMPNWDDVTAPANMEEDNTTPGGSPRRRLTRTTECNMSAHLFLWQMMDRVVDCLKLEDSSEKSVMSLPLCPPERIFYFYDKVGVVKPGEKHICCLHLPPVRKGYAVSATFTCEVTGGPTENFKVTVANLRRPVELTEDSISLGVKPWYEMFKARLRTLSVTEFHTIIQMQQLPLATPRKWNRIADGCVRLLTPREYNMNPFGSRLIRFEGILGFCSEFQRRFKFTINESEELYVRLHGQGVMPMLVMVNRQLRHIHQTQREIAQEYLLLQRIYSFEMFRDITAVDVEFPPAGEEEEEEGGEGPPDKASGDVEADSSQILHQLMLGGDGAPSSASNAAGNRPPSIKSSSSSTTSSISATPSGSIASEELARREERKATIAARRARFDAMMATWVRIDDSAEWPEAMLLTQLLATERFIDCVAAREDMSTLLQSVYQEYQRQMRTCDEKVAFSLKHFTVQPLPCHLHGYVLDMGRLVFGATHTFEFDLHFNGPGRLIAAARTSIKIHGLCVSFEVDDTEQLPKHTGGGGGGGDGTHIAVAKHLHHRLCENTPDFYDKHYRNVYERARDYEMDERLKHAHSFDCKDYWCGLHSRFPPKFTASEIRSVHNYYSGLKRSVYLEHKHHIVLGKIFTRSRQNVTGTQLRVRLEFTPTTKFYDEAQLVEDFLYIDLHLGPTLPILLSGQLQE